MVLRSRTTKFDLLFGSNILIYVPTVLLEFAMFDHILINRKHVLAHIFIQHTKSLETKIHKENEKI